MDHKSAEGYIFLVSRQGRLPAGSALEATIAGVEGGIAKLVGCSAPVADQLLRGEAGSTPLKMARSSVDITVEMYSYMAFALKSELV